MIQAYLFSDIKSVKADVHSVVHTKVQEAGWAKKVEGEQCSHGMRTDCLHMQFQ